MFRALSYRSGRGYEKLTDEDSAGHYPLAAKLDRARSLPAKIFSASRKSNPDHDQNVLAKSEWKKANRVSKIHPVFNLVDRRLRRKATAKPEFSRYMQYLKEGGLQGIANPS